MVLALHSNPAPPKKPKIRGGQMNEVVFAKEENGKLIMKY
jgi:hypothetical protein